MAEGYNIYVPSIGPRPCDLMFIAEAPGKDEATDPHPRPLIGRSGEVFDDIFRTKFSPHGLFRSQVFITNVSKYRPPDNEIEYWLQRKKGKIIGAHERIIEGLTELSKEIDEVNPRIIVPMGSFALWALRRDERISNWNCSDIIVSKDRMIIPCFHPAYAARDFSIRFIIAHTFDKIIRRLHHFRATGDFNLIKPKKNYIVRPSFSQVTLYLQSLLKRMDDGEVITIAGDIELFHRYLSCVALSWEENQAISIPFVNPEEQDHNYWRSLSEELCVRELLDNVMSHKNCQGVGQNWYFDAQFLARQAGIRLNLKHDTMIFQHCIFQNDLPKRLEFQSSLWLDHHYYWKDEGRKWDPEVHPPEQHWLYNCEDADRTRQISLIQSIEAKKAGILPSCLDRMKDFNPLLHMTFRGLRVDEDRRKKMLEDVEAKLENRLKYLRDVCGHPLNPRSPKKVMEFFYDDLRIKPVYKRDAKGKWKRTANDEAIRLISLREPLVAPLCNAIAQYRSLGVARAFLSADRDADGRMRTQFGLGSVETYRLNSAEDIFGEGTNLQNVTEGDREPDANGFQMPNLRTIFIPDDGYIFYKCDLRQADARVVQREAGDPILREIFEDPTRDLHNENCILTFGSCNGKRDPRRQGTKEGVHCTHYKGGEEACAYAISKGSGIPISPKEAKHFQDTYLDAHPWIRTWWGKVAQELAENRYVENKFGYRRQYLGWMDDLLKEALAWKPQSTIAIITLKALRELDELDYIEPLVQVHDDLLFQAHESVDPELLVEAKKKMHIVVPYDDPLIVPWDFQQSALSWGEMETSWLQNA